MGNSTSLNENSKTSITTNRTYNNNYDKTLKEEIYDRQELTKISKISSMPEIYKPGGNQNEATDPTPKIEDLKMIKSSPISKISSIEEINNNIRLDHDNPSNFMKLEFYSNFQELYSEIDNNSANIENDDNNEIIDSPIEAQDNEFSIKIVEAPINIYENLKLNCNPPQASPTNLSDFIFLKTIGKGTFGKVVLVRSKNNPNLLYALKYFKKANIIKYKFLKQLISEKKTVEKLNHPFIIKLYGTFQNEDKIFMTFEYCNGGELFFHLQRKQRFDEATVQIFAAQLFLAISYLHKKGILYRDIKTENLILNEKGNLKLIDFGLAINNFILGNPVWTVCGTTEYIPPEVILGGSYGTSFDWWGFGIFIYEMLIGIPPFTDETGNKNNLFKKIAYDQPNYKFIDDRIIYVSDEAKSLLSLLLEKNPKNRIKPQDIPKHCWFKGINFDDVLEGKLQSLFVPETKNLEDCSNFDTEFLEEECLTPPNKKRPLEDIVINNKDF